MPEMPSLALPQVPWLARHPRDCRAPATLSVHVMPLWALLWWREERGLRRLLPVPPGPGRPPATEDVTGAPLPGMGGDRKCCQPSGAASEWPDCPLFLQAAWAAVGQLPAPLCAPGRACRARGQAGRRGAGACCPPCLEHFPPLSSLLPSSLPALRSALSPRRGPPAGADPAWPTACLKPPSSLSRPRRPRLSPRAGLWGRGAGVRPAGLRAPLPGRGCVLVQLLWTLRPAPSSGRETSGCKGICFK